MTTVEDDAAAGVRLAQQAIRAAADGNDDQILSLINSGTHAQTAWAASYLVAAVRDVAWRWSKQNPRKASRALHAAANNMEDALSVRLALMLEADRGTGQ